MKKLIAPAARAMGKLDARTRRERLLLLAAVCTLLIFCYVQFVHLPLQHQASGLSSEQQSVQKDIAALESRAELIVRRSQRDPNAKLRREIEQLKKEIASLDARLRRRTVDLISPGAMAGLLEDMLRANETLEIVSLENLEPVPLDLGQETKQSSPAGEPSSETPSIFRHPVRIAFSGDYLNTLQYLRRLEAIDQRFFWDQLEFEIEEHPKSSITLTVHTLSLDRRWVGI